jgi:hypothetical protein
MRKVALTIAVTLLLGLGAWGQAPTSSAPATANTNSSADKTPAKKNKSGHHAGHKHKKQHKTA